RGPGRGRGSRLRPWSVVNALPLELIDGEPPPPDLPGAIEGRNPWQLAWARLRRDRVAIASLIVIAFITAVALAAPLIVYLTGHGPNEQFQPTGLTVDGLPKPPSSTFLFGTDDLGRDVLVRVVYGARISLLAGALASTFAVALGVIVGLAGGYFGGAVD